MEENKKWRGKSYGGKWGNLCFVFLLKHFGPCAAYVLLLFVALYFTAFKRTPYRASGNYLKRILGKGRHFMPYHVFRHNLALGITLIDKGAYLAGNKRIKCENLCEDMLGKSLSGGSGAIVLTPHVGCREIAMESLKAFCRKIKILGIQTEDEQIRRVLESFAKQDIESIDASSFGALIESYKALKNGDILAMQFDRDIGEPKVKTRFLGGEVQLPASAFKLSEVARCDMIYCACVREKLFHYKIVPLLIVKKDEPRGENFAAEKTAEVMKCLEKLLAQNKYQWFNFYDYWD